MNDKIGSLQLAIYVMCGGGHTGQSAATAPARFYLDSRMGRRPPYAIRDIKRVVFHLCEMAKEEGLDPYKLPEHPILAALPSCAGVF